MHIAPNIYIAKIDHRSVVLDLDRDQYIGLNADLSETLQKLSLGIGKEKKTYTAGQHNVEKLLRRGFLTGDEKAENRASQPLPPSPPNSSLWARLSDERRSDECIYVAGMVSAAISLTQVATSLRFHSFKHTIDWLKKTKIEVPLQKIGRRTRPFRSTQALVDAFYEFRPYFPLKPICRLDALSLYLHLRRNGQDAQLVFGVRLDPFAAHCWIQIGEAVIDEAWDRIRQYTPILVV